MKIKEVMIKKVITVKKEQTLIEAAQVLVKNNISGAPVVDSRGKLVGMLSEKDLFRALYPDIKDILKDVRLWLGKEKIKHRVEAKRGILVENLMIKKIISIGPEAEILEAGSIMLTGKIHRLPVVKNKKLVGIVSRPDIFRNLLKADLQI
ncbi:CBS domain-containing protein [Candidatus Falkowbacteria bacterium]|nr:CBS domain-containing protein [Candidatus Falkowbacteria bacterium]